MRHDPGAPPLAGLPNPSAASQMDDDYDALAELFLGGEPAHAEAAVLDEPVEPDVNVQPKPTPAVSSDPAILNTPAPPAPDIHHRAKIEALILGHLPGMGSPWASQYAAALAEDLDEPVGLIRLTERELSVELIAGAEHEPAPAPIGLPIEQAIAHVASHTPRVLVRVDAVHEPQVVSSKLLDAITVLSGADEAAVVSSYRTMKGIACQRPHGEPARFQAAIMGVNPHDAQRALAHLRRAVRTFLDDELTQAPGVQRVAPVRKTTLCRDYFTGSVEDLLTLIAAAKQGATSPSDDSETEAHQFTPNALHQSPLQSDEPDVRPARPAHRRETHGADIHSSLAGRIDGLHPLQSRCPHCDGVELAADENGRLHLLMPDNAATVGDLIAVKAWAKAHAAILRRAEPLLAESAGEIALHIFTDCPPAARRLLDTPVHVHLLARADSDGYVCLPLNDPD